MRIKGTIVRWYPERGYAFAKMHAGDGRDIFVHASHVKEGKSALFVGAEISFELLEERGRRQADKVRVLSRITQ